MRKQPDARSLAELPLFAHCTAQELAKISRLIVERVAADGEEIVRQGESASDSFVVAEGTLDVLVDGHAVGRLSAGSIFGEVAALDGGNRTATVIATGPARLLAFSRFGLESMLSEHPRIAQKVMRALSERLRATYRRDSEPFRGMPELAAAIRSATRGRRVSGTRSNAFVEGRRADDTDPVR